MAIPPTDIQILFTNYDIIAYFFLNLASCSEHFISIKHRIFATFYINNKINSDSLYAFKDPRKEKIQTCINEVDPPWEGPIQNLTVAINFFFKSCSQKS